MQQKNVVVIGGGIVGLATAYQLTRQSPGVVVTVLEKEPDLAQHQTGHNSGVLHSGVYYKPGSLKAVNCREGRQAMVDFCQQEHIDFDICGKVIVAVDQTELPALKRIYDRGQANRVDCELIDGDRLRELEPHAAGIEAIHVPDAGIVNFRQVCQRMAERIREAGGQMQTSCRVTKIRHVNQQVVVETTAGEFVGSCLVNCTGLHSDRMTKLSGQTPTAKIIPFRGEYYELRPEVHHLCRNLIYPVPDPEFPFLGVHFTRMIDGSVECGPNAVLAFSREGYRKTDVNWSDLFESLSYSGFLRLAGRYWRVGAGELWRSFSKRAFVRALQRLVPDIRRQHLTAAPAGVRAQAVTPAGQMVDDFLILESDRVINVCNAPSPAATSSLNIGKLISDQVAVRLQD